MIWLDAQLSPKVAKWIREELKLEAKAASELGLLFATDEEIFRKAREADVIVMTKDADFLRLLDRYGPPPKIIWLTCGNSSNLQLQKVLSIHLHTARSLLANDALVEIGDA